MIPIDEVVYFDIVTHDPATGGISDADSTPTFDVYEEATDTGLLGATNFTKRTSLTGNYRGTFTASAANGFEAGKWYSVIASATVGGVSAKSVAMSFRVAPAEGTAGVPKVDVDRVNNVSASSVTTVNANVGTTQPTNFTGTGASALVKSDVVDIAGAAVSTSTAQIGVNVVSYGGVAGTFASGRPEVNTTHWKGTAAATVDTAGYPVVTVKDGTGAGEIDTSSGRVQITEAQIDQIVDEVWDETLPSHVIGSSASVYLQNAGNFAAVVSSTDLNAMTNAYAIGAFDIRSVTENVVGSILGDVAGKILGGGGSTITATGAWVVDDTGTPFSAYALVNDYVAGDFNVHNVTGNVGGSIGSLGTQAKADVKLQVDNGLVDINLDHLAKVAAVAGDVVNSSIIARITSKSATPAFTSYDNTTDSLEAQRDNIGTTGAALVLAKTTNITGFNDLSAAQVNAEADTALADVGVTTTVTGRIDVAVSSRLATASYTAPDNTSITAIKSKTDNLPASPAAVGSAMTLTVGERNAVADAHLDRTDGVETGITPRQALRAVTSAIGGDIDGNGTVYHAIGNNGTTRITFVDGGSGNRTVTPSL